MAKRKGRRKPKRLANRRQQAAAYETGVMCFYGEDYAGAIRAWRSLVKQEADPTLQVKLAEAHFRYATLLIRADQHARVLSELQQAVQHAPRRSVYHYHLGLAYHRHGDQARAAEAYQKALTLEPDNKRYQQHLEIALAEMGRSSGDSLFTAAIALQQADGEEAPNLEGEFADPDSVGLLQGIALALQGQFAPAKRLLNKCRGPNSAPIASHYLGLIYSQEDKLPSAIKHLETASREPMLEPHARTLLLDVYKRQAAKYASSGDEAKANQLWRKVAQLDPNDPAATNIAGSMLDEGYRHATDGDFTQAMRTWKRAINLGISTPELLQNYAIACDRNDRHFDALNTWSQLAKIWEDQLRSTQGASTLKKKLALVYRRIGETAWHLDDIERAETAYQRVLEFTPDNIEIHLRLIGIEIEYGDPSTAIRQLKRLSRKYPDDTSIYEMMMGAYLQEDDLPEALRVAIRIVKLDPRNTNAREMVQGLGNSLVGSMRHEGKLGPAERLLEDLLQVDPEFPPFLYEKMALLLKKSKPDEATAVADQLLDMADDKIEAQARVGSFHWFNGYPDKAEEYFEKVGGVKCDHPTALLLIAVAYLEGDTRKAGRYFSRIRKHPEATAEKYLEMALGMAQTNRHELAQRIFEYGLRHFPNSLELLMGQITVAVMAEEFALAEKAISKARQVAHRQGNYELVGELDSMGMALRMQRMFGSSPFGGLFGGFFDEFDEDDEPF